jgi:putative ABC transport system ATP-binding protein
MKTIIKTEGLCRFYHPGRSDEVRAIVDVDLEIRENQYVVFHGPSGCGKTTLLSLISSIDRPTKGKVFLYGEDITGFSDVGLSRIRQETIGFVFQSFNLILHSAAWENVAFPLIPIGIREKERYKRAQRLLEDLGLGERLHHFPEELSGGEQQRVAIARALINDPKIIIADEPTSNIDAASISQLLKILKNLQKAGKAILISTHDPIFQGQADITYYLESGRIMDTKNGGRQ